MKKNVVFLKVKLLLFIYLLLPNKMQIEPAFQRHQKELGFLSVCTTIAAITSPLPQIISAHQTSFQKLYFCILSPSL